MAQIRCYFMSDFYGCVFWVGFCVFIIYYPFTKKIFSCMAVGFLVHMKSTRVSKMFQRNKSRQHWSCSVGLQL